MEHNPPQVKIPYTSRGKRIHKSRHHADMWIIDIVGTNKFYSINMSTTQMLLNNPPDPEPTPLKVIPPFKTKIMITTNKVVDSHGDVHAPGVFKKAIQQNRKRTK